MEKNQKSLRICGKHGEIRTLSGQSIRNHVLKTELLEMEELRSGIVRYIKNTNRIGMKNTHVSNLWKNV